MDTQLELVLEDKIMTASEAANMLGVTSAAITHWCKAGYFPNAYRVNPRKAKSPWRIPKRNLEAFVDERRQQRGYFYMPVAG
ncbi:MAG: helix-turn-helix domain-containing protein [Anaerolineae bacterium]|nr:helix-turn-helix domain-containing protein [Anaerolineae bacterium]